MPRRRNGFSQTTGHWTQSSRISRSLEKPSHHPYASTNWIRFEGSPRCLKASGISARCPGSPGEWRNLEATAPGLSSRPGSMTAAPLPRAMRAPSRAMPEQAGKPLRLPRCLGRLVALWSPAMATSGRPATRSFPANSLESGAAYSICPRIAWLTEAPCKLCVRLFCASRSSASLRGRPRGYTPITTAPPVRPAPAAASSSFSPRCSGLP